MENQEGVEQILRQGVWGGGEDELTLALPSGIRSSWCSQISPKHVVRTYCPLSGKCCAISWIARLQEHMS